MLKEAQSSKKRDLAEILKAGKFWEYPPHNRPEGICQIKTNSRNVYYQWVSDGDIDWALFNDALEIHNLQLYCLRKEEMQKILKENDNCLIFKMDPTYSGTSAYEKLKRDYPSDHWIGQRFPSLRHLDNKSFEKMDEFLKSL